MGKGWTTLAEGFQVGQNGRGDPHGGRLTVIKLILQAREDEPEPGRLDCGCSGRRLLWIRHVDLSNLGAQRRQ